MAELMTRRILLMSGWYYPDTVGGTEEYVHILAKELCSMGWDVTIAAPSKDEQEHDYLYEGIKVYRYPLAFISSTSVVRSEIPPEYFEVFTEWFKKNRFDLVHIHSFVTGCGLFQARFIKQMGVPLMLTVHIPGITCVRGSMKLWGKVPCDGKISVYRCTACWIQRYGIASFFAWSLSFTPEFISNRAAKLKNRLGTALQMRKLFVERDKKVREFLNLFDRIVVVAEWIYDNLVYYGIPKSKISLCRHGILKEIVNFKKDREMVPGRVIRIGFIGRFDWVKGLDVLIKAVKALPDNFPIELDIYGITNSQEAINYFKRVQRLAGKDKRIKFCGEATRDQFQEVLNSLDMLAVPSLWMEAGPFVVLEAFAAGVPVIGSNLGGIPELVSDGVNGILVNVGSVKNWISALKWLIEHPESIKKFSQAIPHVRTSGEMAKEMKEIYEKVI